MSYTFFSLAFLASIAIAVSLIHKGKRSWGWVVVGLLVVVFLFLTVVVVKSIEHMPFRRRTERPPLGPDPLSGLRAFGDW